MPSTLFSPFRLDGIELANRIVVAPMAQYSAGANGLVGPWHLMHLGNLAISGAALVVMEATAVEPKGRISLNCPGLWDDAQAERLREVTDFCKEHGAARLAIQLAHSGRKASVKPPWDGQRTITADEGGWRPVSSSHLAFPGRPSPQALGNAELQNLRAHYVAAARRAHRAGFDVLELHCAHGYLMHSFLSPLVNVRADRYGGDIEGRMRYPLEVFSAVRDAWPSGKPVGVRVSATDWIEGGWTLDQTVILAARLKQLGCAYVSASSGGTLPQQQIPIGPGYQVPLAEAIRRETGVPTIAAGIIDEPAFAESVLANGSADLIAIGRGMTYNPRWAWHAAAQMGARAHFPKQYARSHPSMRHGDHYKMGPERVAFERPGSPESRLRS
jgi:2,4-dienoyl-CoA reductase-like NADH-dependent reductase (Old Yellow Enzyme family)